MELAKRILAAFLALCLLLALTACSGGGEKQSAGADGEAAQAQSQSAASSSSGRPTVVCVIHEPTPIKKLVSSSACIFEGTFLREEEIEELPYTWTLVFHVDHTLKGELTEETVSVRTSSLYLTEGVKYLVFCESTGSVFEGKQGILYTSDVVSQGKHGLNVQSGLAGTEGKTYADVVLAAELAIELNQSERQTHKGDAFCESDDLGEIYGFSNTVVVAVPESVFYNGTGDRTTYQCRVERTVKGEEFETILVTAMKDSLQLGQSYVLMLMQNDAGSWFTSISSRSSVFPADSDEAEQILSLAS